MGINLFNIGNLKNTNLGKRNNSTQNDSQQRVAEKQDQERGSGQQGKEFQDNLKEQGLERPKLPQSNALKQYNKQTHHPAKDPMVAHAKDICQRHIHSIDKGASVNDALRKMSKHDIHALPVLEANETLVGMVHDRDILSKRASELIANGHIVKARVISKNLDLKSIARIFWEEDHSILIVSDRSDELGEALRSEEIFGIITKKDIIGWLSKSTPNQWHA